MTAGQDGRRRQRRSSRRRPTTPARRSACSPPASPSPSASARACSSARGLGLRGKRPAALREIPPLPGRRAERRRKRRRHLRAGLLRRPAGRLPRGPQPGPDRPRHGRHALVAARLRPHRRRTSRGQDTPRNLMGFKDGTANIRAEDADAMGRFVWVGDDGPGLDARRHLPGHPPHPHAARDLGPLVARRPGADDRPRQVRAARRSAAPSEFDPLDLEAERGGEAADPRRRPRAARLAPRRTAASGSCAAATPSPTASTRASASSTPASSSSASSATRSASSSRSSGGSAPSTRSTSTSSTSAAPSSRCRRARAGAATSARRCSADARLPTTTIPHRLIRSYSVFVRVP